MSRRIRLRPRIYVNHEGGSYHANQERHYSLVDSLEKQLLQLLSNDRSKSITPRVVSVDENPEKSWNKPTTRLYNYDNRGFVVSTHSFTGVDWNYSSSRLEVKAFPSSQGKMLLRKLDKIMEELGFEEVLLVDFIYKFNLDYI